MKVLHIAPAMDGGGIDRILFDYCSRIIPKISFDFVVTSETIGILEKPLENMGCKIYHIPQMRTSIRKHNRALEKIINVGQYDIVHVHSSYRAAIDLRTAKKCGVRVRIAHSHMAYMPESFKDKIIRKFFTALTKYYATDLFACGQDAAKWTWGVQHRVYLMRNAIDISKFIYDNEKRQCIRKEYNIENKIVLGNVARFTYQKNHEFLLMVLSELIKCNPNVVLLLIGTGELFLEIKNKAKKMGVEKHILFLGVRDNVPDFLNAMDAFVLPSHYEGLPVSLVEVQANGLPTWASDSITKEIKVASNMYYLSLKEDASIWASYILRSSLHRENTDMDVAGYNIEIEAKGLAEKYLNM